MTEEQIAHAQQLAATFAAEMTEKYRKGVAEHGGNIWDMSIEHLLDEAILENIDQFVYLCTVREKLRGRL